MEQFILYNYAVKVNDRMVRIVAEPGTSWEDLFEGIEKLLDEIHVVKEEVEKRERELKEIPVEVTA